MHFMKSPPTEVLHVSFWKKTGIVVSLCCFFGKSKKMVCLDVFGASPKQEHELLMA